MNNYLFTKRRRSSGFTLIELVITIAILMVVSVIVIPAVRMLNKDRKVHDTARIAGSVFSAARERAAVDGSAGVEILSQANDPNLSNMGMVLYQLRAIPPYNGDTINHEATVTINSVALNELTPGDATVNFTPALSITAGEGDYIEFGNSGIQYEIINPVPVNQGIQIRLPFMVPAPPEIVELPFKIYRQPVRVESSVVRMPRNLFLNFLWSGHGIDGNQFGAGTGSVRVWFNKDGSIDRVINRTSGLMERPSGPLYILMCTGEGDEVDVTELDDDTSIKAQRFIEDDNNLWIVVDHLNGGVSLGAIAELGSAGTLAAKITASRLLAKNRRSTTP